MFYSNFVQSKEYLKFFFLIWKKKIWEVISSMWVGLDYGWIKLNTDDSASENPGSAECALMLKNEWGRWIKGLQRWIEITNNPVFELWAIRNDLILRNSLGVQATHVEFHVKETNNFIMDAIMPTMWLSYLCF